MAKRDLKAGEEIDELGGYTVTARPRPRRSPLPKTCCRSASPSAPG